MLAIVGLTVPSVSAEDETVVPSSPRDLVATAGDSGVSLSWTAPMFDGASDIQGYRVYRNGDFVAQVAILEYQDNLAELDDLFIVRAFNLQGEGVPSRPASVLTGACIITALAEVPPGIAANPECLYGFQAGVCEDVPPPAQSPACQHSENLVDIIVATWTWLNPGLEPPIDLTGTGVDTLYGEVYRRTHIV